MFPLATPALPTHPGAIENCGQYYDVVEGDTVSYIPHRIVILMLANHKIIVRKDCGEVVSVINVNHM